MVNMYNIDIKSKLFPYCFDYFFKYLNPYLNGSQMCISLFIFIITEIEVCGGGGVGGGSDEEPYEEAAPLHGDRLFHAFLTRLRNHPGQILRY